MPTGDEQAQARQRCPQWRCWREYSQHGAYLTGRAEVTIGEKVRFMDSASRLLGDSVAIKQGTQVYDVFYNELVNRGAILGEQHTPLTLPLVSALPPVPAFTPGTQDIEVRQNGTLTLDAGDYGRLLARNRATITFTGGVYTFSEWDIREGVKLYFMAPTEIRIAGKLDIGAKTYLGPAPGVADLSAADILIIVTGSNGRTGGLHAGPKAAEFGEQNTVLANVYVPQGTLWLRQKTVANGAFVARWVIVGEKVELTWSSGF